MSNNLELWDNAKYVDPKHTEKAEVGTRRFTSIKGIYPVMMATSLWGPVGVGWGYEIVNERFDSTGDIFNSEGVKVNEAKLHTLLIKVWFMNDGVKSETPCHYGHTKFIYQKSGTPQKGKEAVIDYEYAKKSLTDALNKCLSMFGFCADVYLGSHDDPTFVEQSKYEAELKEAEDIASAISEKREELLDYIASVKIQLEMIPSKAACILFCERAQVRINGICGALKISSEKSKKQVDVALKDRLSELKQKEEIK